MGWAIAAILIGLALTSTAAYMGLLWLHAHPGKRNALDVIIPVFCLTSGPLFGLFFVLFGLGRLLTTESLELDTVTARGLYSLRSRVRGERKRLEFPLTRIHHISLEHRLEPDPSGQHLPRAALRARLLLDKPREAIELDDTQNRHEARVRALAGVVSEFLHANIVETGRES